MSTLGRRAIILAVIGLHLGVDLVGWRIADRLERGPWGSFGWMVLCGFILGQLSLLAGYWAVGPGHWWRRLVVACGLTALVWWALIWRQFQQRSGSIDFGLEQLTLIAVTAAFCCLACAHWLVRAFAGIRVLLPSNERPAEAGFIPRFGVRHLLVSMVVVAVLCVIIQSPIGKAVWGRGWSFSLGEWEAILGIPAVWAAVAATLSIPGGWICLASDLSARRLMLFAVYSAVIAAVTVIVGFAIWRDDARFAIALLGIPLTAGCDAIGCGLVLRGCGYRVVRGGEERMRSEE